MARTFGEMGIREIQTGLAAKEFSAAEVTRGTFERIGEADGAVHAFLETPRNSRSTRRLASTPPSPRGASPRWARSRAFPWATRTT